MSNPEKTVHILLAEDDQIDQKAFLRAFDKLRIKNPVTIAKDGLEAWEILKGSNGRQLPQQVPAPVMTESASIESAPSSRARATSRSETALQTQTNMANLRGRHSIANANASQ